MMYKILLIPLLVIGSINLHAQSAVLVDSIMYDSTKYVHYLFPAGDAEKELNAFYCSGEISGLPTELVFKSKNTIKLPRFNRVAYIDEQVVMLESWVDVGVPNVYNSKVLSYEILPNGELLEKDSVRLSEGETASRYYNGIMPKRPLMVTTDDIVEGSGCISAFRIYDENCRKIDSIVPFPESCGVEGLVYVDGDYLNFVSRDANDANHIFFCSINYYTLERVAIQRLKLDKDKFVNFVFYVNGNVYVSGVDKTTTKPLSERFFTNKFNQDGKQERGLLFPNTIQSFSEDFLGNIYFWDYRGNVYVNEKKVEITTTSSQSFLGKYLLLNSPNKNKYIYEIR